MNVQEKLEEAKQLGLKRGYLIGYYIGALQSLKSEAAAGNEIEEIGERAVVTLGLGGIIHRIAKGIITLNLSYDAYLANFGGFFQNELFNDDEFSRQYTETYHMLCDHYDEDIPIDNGSVLAAHENSPFKKLGDATGLVQ